MKLPSTLALLLLLLCGGAACGKEIGDACGINPDCSPNGDRQCDTTWKDGYCTIAGCDFNTCPDEAVCVRFFTGSFGNKPCDRFTEDRSTDDCSFDELCSIEDSCVPRSSELRFCMRKCDSDGDCRDGYECRDFERMKAHGGEPVLEAGEKVSTDAQRFCAIAPAPAS